MFHFRTLSILPIVLSLLLTSSALPDQTSLLIRDVPASLPHITSIQYSGNGCPSSSPAVERGGAWDDVSFRMNAFEVSIPGSSPDSSSKNCEVHMQAAGCAAGWQVGIKDVFVKGRLVLDPGARLDFYVQTFWSEDAANTITVRGNIENSGAGRLDQIATAHATIPSSRVVWSRCTGARGDIGILNVNFRTTLQADGNQYAYFGKDGDGAATESWAYVWRPC